MLRPATKHVGESLKLESRRGVVRLDKYLSETRHHTSGSGPHERRVDRDIAPAQHSQSLGRSDGVDRRLRLGCEVVVDGDEGDSGGVTSGWGQVEWHHCPQERVGNLQEDACAVARVRLCPGRATVVEVAQGRQRLLHHLVAGPPG
ncbi:unannotated protein [freshwater metagenome]|uniref:Unannotated protein n=1 Tax=freshwater metagenome TaxID=449393 RepID=A0A6J7KFW6_9ZZZZ